MSKHGNALVRLYRPAPCQLSYLSWGRRHYGEPPLEPAMHEGWHYFVILAGSPSLTVNGRDETITAGEVSLGDPDCSIGHRDRPGHSCQMLTWIWRTPPAHSALRPQRGKALRIRLGAEQLQRVKRLHAQCRKAVAQSDERGVIELQSSRLLLDLCLLEGVEERRTPDAAVRIDLAIQYLRNHIAEAQPVQGLSAYLQISPASLYRLFQEKTGKSPRAVAQDCRMEWAREKLRSGQSSVKSVAYALAYRHPPDFSRAFKHHFGATATDILRESAV